MGVLEALGSVPMWVTVPAAASVFVLGGLLLWRLADRLESVQVGKVKVRFGDQKPGG